MIRGDFTLRLAVSAVNMEAELADVRSPCGRSSMTVLRARARRRPSRQATAVDWQAGGSARLRVSARVPVPSAAGACGCCLR